VDAMPHSIELLLPATMEMNQISNHACCKGTFEFK
jgi:hypothetical protein